jgi:anti-anti-sigma factor
VACEAEATGDDAFRVVSTWDGTTLVLTVEGELDLAAASTWDDAVVVHLDRGPAQIDVDLGAVTFMDSSGLGVLVKLRSWADGHDARLQLLRVPRNVLRVLEFSGVVELFAISAAEFEPD